MFLSLALTPFRRLAVLFVVRAFFSVISSELELPPESDGEDGLSPRLACPRLPRVVL